MPYIGRYKDLVLFDVILLTVEELFCLFWFYSSLMLHQLPYRQDYQNQVLFPSGVIYAVTVCAKIT